MPTGFTCWYVFWLKVNNQKWPSGMKITFLNIAQITNCPFFFFFFRRGWHKNDLVCCRDRNVPAAFSQCWHKTFNQTLINNEILMLIFQICTKTSICCLSFPFFPPLWVLHLTLFTCFVYSKTPASSFPFLAFPRALCLSLSRSHPPSFLPTFSLYDLCPTLTFTPFLWLFSGTLVMFLAVFSRQRRIWKDCFVFMGEWEQREKREERWKERRTEGG